MSDRLFDPINTKHDKTPFVRHGNIDGLLYNDNADEFRTVIHYSMQQVEDDTLDVEYRLSSNIEGVVDIDEQIGHNLWPVIPSGFTIRNITRKS